MPRLLPEEEIDAILAAMRQHPDGVTVSQIAEVLSEVPLRTLQYRLNRLVEAGRILKEGERRWVKYRLPPVVEGRGEAAGQAHVEAIGISLSKESLEIEDYLQQPSEARKPVGYNRNFLDSYRPNETFYLSEEERARLARVGKPNFAAEAAGTYARQILNRLLIDLSWNSSRLEGNTDSLHDTKRLIEVGQAVEGGDRREAQMILSHKDAIEFLVQAAPEIGFNRYTILNLHAILANNLLADDTAAGRLRHIAVGIEKSAFHPLEVPQLIEECFEQILATAAVIRDPFEQALFM